ncbi:MAG TPA: hypothetical protein VGJ96_13355 [Gemmatimonadaceae bacterium]
MSRAHGFALPVVLAALLVMAMSVAVSAQRALLATRQAALDVARAELAVAAASGGAAALAFAPDSTCCDGMIPGALIGSGTSRAGRAQASWRLIGAAAPYALVELEAGAPLVQGTARASYRLLVRWIPDSVGRGRWASATAAGWIRLPSR